MRTELFRGMRWLVDLHKLGLEYAAEANNLWPRSGGLHPLRFGLKARNHTGDWRFVKSAYKFAGRLIGVSTEAVDFVEHPNNDAFDRLYFVDPGTNPADSNQGLIKFYEGDAIPAGQVLNMNAAHRLGIQPPNFRADGAKYLEPAVFVNSILPADTGRDIFITHLIFANVNKWGEESAPSPPTIDFKYRRSESAAGVEIQPNLTGDPNIIGVRAYMRINGSYYRVNNYYDSITYNVGGYKVENLSALTASTRPSTLDQNVQAIFLNLIISDTPNEELVSLSWDRPPQGIKHLIMLDNNVMVGARKGEVVMSVPGYIHAFPADTIHRRALAGEIKGLMKVSGGFVAVTDIRAHMFIGVTAETMTEINIDFPYPLGDKRSLVTVDGTAIWITHEGIAALGSNGGQILTAGWTERDIWGQYIDWENCQCAVHEQRLIVFAKRPSSNTEKGYIFDLRLQEVVSFDCSLNTLNGLVHRDMESGEIWFSHDANGLNRFNRGSYMTAKWRSGRVDVPQGYIPGGVRIQSDTGEQTQSLKFDMGIGKDVDGARLQNVTSDKPFWCGLPYLARWFQFQIESNYPVSHSVIDQDIQDV